MRLFLFPVYAGDRAANAPSANHSQTERCGAKSDPKSKIQNPKSSGADRAVNDPSGRLRRPSCGRKYLFSQICNIIRCPRLVYALFVFLLLTGCHSETPTPPANPSAPASSKEAKGFPRTVTDARGKVVTISAAPQRIVSLAPSNTEILFALHLDSRIAGVTDQCDFPPEAKRKPNVGGYPISAEKVLSLNPDLVIVVGAINTKEADALEQAKIPVVAVNPKTLADVYASIELVGRVTGADNVARNVVQQMQTETDAIEKQITDVKSRPKTLILYQAGPLYTTNPDSFIADAVRSAGSDYLVKTNLPGSVISPEQVLLDPPDVILCAPEIVSSIKALPGFAAGVPAVKDNRFFTAEGALTRPGPRLPQAIAALARYLHPDFFPRRPATAPPPGPK